MSVDQSDQHLSPLPARRTSPRLSLGCAILAVLLIVLYLYWADKADQIRLRVATKNDFRAVMLAVNAYGFRLGQLPYPIVWSEMKASASESNQRGEVNHPLYSWRAVIATDFDDWRWTWKPSKPWNDPANREVKNVSGFFVYNIDERPSGFSPFLETKVLAITGSGTAFGDGHEPPMRRSEVPPQMILLVESRNSGIPWPAPGDLDVRTMPRTFNTPDGRGISSRYSGGFHVAFADGSIWFISDKIPFETLSKFFTVAEAVKSDRDLLLGPFMLDH